MSGTIAEVRWQRAIYALSAAVCAVVAFLILGPRPEGLAGQLDVSSLPAVNAFLNGLTAVLLVIGFALVRSGRIPQHRAVMLTAFGTSSAFLVSYVLYHWFSAGPRHYEGDFVLFYRVLLVTHILLAVVILPMALTTLYRGLSGSIARHRKLARVTLPLWLYVSASGVLIYAMLY